MIVTVREFAEFAHHEAIHIWPEVMGGFIAFWVHHFKHSLFKAILHGVPHLLKGR